MPLRRKKLVGQGIHSECDEVSAVTKACRQRKKLPLTATKTRQDFVYISADDSWRFCITTRIRLLVDIIPHSNSFLITDFLDTHNYT